MKRPTTRRSALALIVCATSVAALQGIASPMAGAATHKTPVAQPVSAVNRLESQTARALAASLADPAWRAQVRTAALGSKEVDLSALTGKATAQAGKQLASAVTKADQGIATAKGLDKSIGSLLRLRLGTQAMAKELKPGTEPLVAAAITGHQAKTVTAYDAQGVKHTLSVQTAPKQAVYVIDLDVSKANAVGMKAFSKTLNAAGIQSGTQVAGIGSTTQKKASAVRPAADGYWATKMDTVWLSNDEEPWIEGDAEIYSLVSGFGLDGVVRVDSVDMPYLDNDHTTYNPGQLIINWSNFKYNALDLVMMESDGSTNYQALAQAIADALLTITDNGAYQPLVDAVLNAIPSSWYSNDDDYVDSWYAITEQTSGTIYGAANNGWMTVEPYWVSAL